MKIRFRLNWTRGDLSPKQFKSAGCYALFSEYLKRISHFAPCAGAGADPSKNRPNSKVWLCHSSKDSKALSSEALAAELEKLNMSGAKELEVVIGPADGFSKGDILAYKPDLLWSFGPMTLPHELASVVAAEQIYRAFTILRNLPYHSSH